MSVQLSPLTARRRSIGVSDDPYKKYWWVILAGFVATGGWLCIPIMETPVGSAHVDGPGKPAVDAASIEQGLDSADNPNGAPGGALDLSMDGAKHKSKSGDEDMTSMLYQGSPDASAAAADGKPLGDATAGSAANLAQQLKDVSKKAEAAGGWTEKAQNGFSAPHLSGGGLPGAGSMNGHSSASSGLGTNFFGSKNAQVAFGSAQGLHDDGSAGSAGFRALKASAGAAAQNLAGSNEEMHAGMSQAFDGAKGKAPAQIGTGAMAQANGVLNSAPANLKTKPNASNLDTKKLPDPIPAPPPPAPDNIGQQIAMIAATALAGAVVGGLVGGVGAQIVMSAGTAAMSAEQQKQAADQAAAAERLKQ